MTEAKNLDLDPKYVIDTLIEENRSLNENRLYLMSTLRQLNAEYENDKTAWEVEKQSLIKSE